MATAKKDTAAKTAPELDVDAIVKQALAEQETKHAAELEEVKSSAKVETADAVTKARAEAVAAALPGKFQSRHITAYKAKVRKWGKEKTEREGKPMRVRVQAGEQGYYDHKRWREGDVLTIDDATHFSSRWMVKVDDETKEKLTTGKQALQRHHDEILGSAVRRQEVEEDAPTGGQEVLAGGAG